MRRDQQHREQPGLFDGDDFCHAVEQITTDSDASESLKPKSVTDWDRDIQPSIDQVDQNADADWKATAIEILRGVAETKEVLTADDVLELLDKENVETHQRSALGPVFLHGKRLGWIVTTGRMVQSRIPVRHRKLTEWRSQIMGMKS